MKARHVNCQDADCSVCFADAVRLQKRLEVKLGHFKGHLGRPYDLLGEYRKFLDINGIYAETEFGWPTNNVYKESNIENFIEWFGTTKEGE